MGLSRNKVAVSEGAAGSPPFYGECGICRETDTVFDGEVLIEELMLFNLQRRMSLKKIGLSNAQGPPVPIPNTEVKLCSAENTSLETMREDRSRPISVKGCYITAFCREEIRRPF